MVDEGTRKSLSNIPLLKTKAGPREKEAWIQRLKEEYQSLIKVGKSNPTFTYVSYQKTPFSRFLVSSIIIVSSFSFPRAQTYITMIECTLLH